MTALQIVGAAIYAAGTAIMFASGWRYSAYSLQRYGRRPTRLGLVAMSLIWPLGIVLLGPREVLLTAFSRENHFVKMWRAEALADPSNN